MSSEEKKERKRKSTVREISYLHLYIFLQVETLISLFSYFLFLLSRSLYKVCSCFLCLCLKEIHSLF